MVNIETHLNLGFDVNVTQMNMSKSTLHIEIDLADANVCLYASEKQIEEFINRLEYSLERYKKMR